jgi:hypothetical protein
VLIDISRKMPDTERKSSVLGRQSAETIEKISQELNTGLSPKALTAIVDLLTQGYSPESIVSLINESYREKSNILDLREGERRK